MWIGCYQPEARPAERFLRSRLSCGNRILSSDQQSDATPNLREWHQPGESCLLCMIVEDEAVISLALEDEFMNSGYEVIGPYASCSDALQALKHSTPAVAVLDTVLKDGSCIELARELTRLGVPFVIYSGKEKQFESAPEFQGILWIPKPAFHSDVVAAVDGLVRR